MLIIGFGNRARQGKDTAAEAILDYYNNHMRWNEDERRMTLCGVKVGIFKFATALYVEVNGFLATDTGKRWLAREKRPETFAHIITPLDWVKPDPNPEISSLFPYGKHPKLLQWWGTEYRRENFGENYWVDKMFASIPINLDIALISDVRFPNEADAIKQRGGYCVNVQRICKDGSRYYSTDRPADHPSETALDNYNWDFRLSNPDGHQAWLEEQAITLCEYLRGLHENIRSI
jgi:hypothetical protein